MDNIGARGKLLETLRFARGMTQVELADATDIAQATLSKAESGALELDIERWTVLADALGVPVSAFLEVVDEVKPALIFHRKQRTTPQSAVRRIGANAALARQRVNAVISGPRGRLRRHDLDDGFVTPQEVAGYVRKDFGVQPTDPIADLTGLIEDAGAIVLFSALDSMQVDAVATWPEEDAPVILVADHVSPERQRFTMAHELGHAVMHGEPVEDVKVMDRREKEADAFAAEFLLPSAELQKEWPGSADIDQLIALKRRWGVSLSALIRRAVDTDLITEREYREWSIRLSTSGMHRREPSPMSPESPQRLFNAIQSEIDNGTTVEELAARAHMYPTEFRTTFMEMEHTS